MPTKTSNTVDYHESVSGDALASLVGNMWQQWKSSRSGWEAERHELRNYLFATDTSTTTNGNLPWKNTTTRPKLTQIRDNLHANYMAALFPHEDFFKWEAESEDAADFQKAEIITAYMRNKIRQSGFMETMSQLVYDYIDYGNAFAEVVYVNESVEDPMSPDLPEVPKYSGPKLVRISPLNIVMNPKAQSFHKTPHIVRSVMSLGELAKLRKTVAGAADWVDEAFAKSLEMRESVRTNQKQWEDTLIDAGITIDGFGTMYEYYESGSVEVLEFSGDIYDTETGELYENRSIIVVDRAYVVYNGPYKSWLGRSNREHVGWRQRPDNLWAMGPLDNLVGMQYRIDHLENLKADVFDQIAHPIAVHRGEVEDWDFGPGARIYMDVDSSVDFLRPDTTALNADFQIQQLENSMEEMAGAPRQAMGIRTPGEKTAFEVQTLENNTGRIFQHKTNYYDKMFVEPVMNQMLASARMNMDAPDLIRLEDPDFGVMDFQTVTRDDLQAKGKLVPKGSTHFARKAQVLQNLNGIVNSAAYADPGVQAHWSGLRLAKAMEELLDLGEFDLIEPNVRIMENAETQALAAQAQQQVDTEQVQDLSGMEAAMDEAEIQADEEAMGLEPPVE